MIPVIPQFQLLLYTFSLYSNSNATITGGPLAKLPIKQGKRAKT